MTSNNMEAKYLEIRWMPMRCFLVMSCSMDHRSVPRDWPVDDPASSTSDYAKMQSTAKYFWKLFKLAYRDGEAYYNAHFVC